MPVSSVTEHWIKQDAIIINLNHFGDPDYLQVSVLAGAVVMAFKQDVIGYNAARNYRTWPLQAANTFFETTDALNVYARLTRSEVNASALIIYDPLLRDIEGRSISYADDGSEVLGEADAEYYYIYLGQISSSINADGNEIEREWSVDFRFGNLDTSEQNNFSGLLLEKMFKPHYDDKTNPNKLTSIEALAGLWTEQFLSAKGMNSGGGSDEPTVGATTLGGLRNVAADADRTYDVAKMLVLEAKSNLWSLKNLSELVGGLDEAELAEYLTKNNYAKKGDIPSLSGYATEQWVLGKGYATTTDLDARIDSLVNGAPAAYDTLKEIADVLAGNVNSISDILTALGNKADKATTLSGYGITDAYTIAQIDSIVNGLSGNISTLQGYFTDGVANSATKLATARTIWGKSFDGTGNVSGDLSGVGSITRSYDNAVDTDAYGNLQFKSTSATDNWSVKSNSGSHLLHVRNGGNVGIGTMTPSYNLDVNGTTRTTKLVIGNGSIEWDETNKGFKIVGGLYTESYLSAKGANSSGGSSSGGGLITSLYRYSDLGKTFSDTNNDTFNAYTINKINADLGSRISVLEGKATNVSFTQSLTSGTQIGTITIDGASKNIYAPTIPTDDINKGVTAYGWGNHATMGYITASASITGNAASASLIKPTTGTGVASSWVSLTSYTKVWGEAFNVSSFGSDTGDIALYLRSGVYTKNSAELCVAIDGDFYAQTGSKKVLHEGNYTDYTYSKTTIDSTLSGYQTKITSSNKLAYSLISGVPTKLSQFTNDLGLGTFAYKSSLAFADLTNKPTTIGGFGITDAYTKSQVDSALSGYLPLSGGTLNGHITFVANDYIQIKPYNATANGGGWANNGLTFVNENNVMLGGVSAHGNNNSLTYLYIGTQSYNGLNLRIGTNLLKWGDNDLIHSGNIGSQSVASAKRLVTDAGDLIIHASSNTFYIGDSIYTEKSTQILGSDIRLRYGASATTGIILTSLGNVGIGTTSPQYNLHVKSVAPALMCESTASESSIYFSASSENAYRWAIGKGVWHIGGDFGIGEYNTAQKLFFRIAKDGNVGIGLSYTTAPSYKLHINGTLHASDAVSFGSTLDVTGAITKPTTSGGNMTSNYISAGGGYSSGTGKYGVKILCCDQADAQTGLGQDLGGFPGGYELSVVGGTSSGGKGYISFVTHGVNSTSYRKLGYFYDNNGVISFDVLGTIHSTTGIWSDGYVSAKGQNTSSDMRLKNVLNEVVLSVKAIANAPSVRFAWKNGGGVDVGSSAQYWQGLLPDAVKEQNSLLEMQYGNIALLSAIAIAKKVETHEERIARVEKHEERIVRLEKENKELRNEIMILKGGNYA